MKIQTKSNIATFGGLTIFLILAFIGWFVLNATEKIQNNDPILSGVLLALGGIIILVGMVLMLLIWVTGDSFNITHHKRILQKHGLWQDEQVSKSELKKDDTTKDN